MARTSILLMTLLAMSCTDPAGDGDDTAGDSSDDTAGTVDVPTDAAALGTWLMDESYSGWAAESAIHASTGPHGMVQTYFNDDLVASFDASNTEHPVGSASVKELYDDMGARIGWAVMVKTTSGDAADSWYWYLESGGSVNADGNGVGTCESCHNAGTDRVLTPYPLQ